ncbi:hypothetical protein [Streptomyces sp. NPDC057199]|uniref:hypothetical protein n=1 Tax=Streptomyces sp. NPDC057199 TaxID=3346047 RepID=UPI003625AEBB
MSGFLAAKTEDSQNEERGGLMHTSALSTNMLEAERNGGQIDPAELLDWGTRDRLCVVVNSPFGGMGASLMIQLAVVRWYEINSRRDPVLNPEIYMIHVGRRWGNQSAYDFWPPRKDICVAGGPMEVLDTINGWGITHLLVPDGPTQEHEYEWREPDTAKDRLKQCFVYSSNGSLPDADIVLRTREMKMLQNSIWTLWPDEMLGVLEHLRSQLQEEWLVHYGQGRESEREVAQAAIARTLESYRVREGEVTADERREQEERFTKARDKIELDEWYREVSADFVLARLAAHDAVANAAR